MLLTLQPIDSRHTHGQNKLDDKTSEKESLKKEQILMKYRVVKDGGVLGEPFEAATQKEANTKAASIGAGQGPVTVEVHDGSSWIFYTSFDTCTLGVTS